MSPRDLRNNAPNDPQPSPMPIDMASENISFIRRIIEKTLVGQPQWIQAVVLFLFVFLFIYVVAFTTQGSILLKTGVDVELSKDAVNKLRQAGKIPRDQEKAYGPPDMGYQIVYSDRYYGLNSNADSFIGVSLPRYLWALSVRRLDVKVLAPGGVTFPHSIPVAGLELGRIFLPAPNNEQQLGAVAPYWIEGGHYASYGELGFIASAAASDANNARLYVQSVTLPVSSSAGAVSAGLSFGGKTQPLVLLSPDLKSTSVASFTTKPGASIVFDYLMYFPLPGVSVSPTSTIQLQSADGLFSKGFSETYKIPAQLEVGKPTSLRGSAGGSLVVQLAYPVDVVFFERSDSSKITEKLSTQVAALGFAPRINLGAARLPGSYNVIYSGKDVPMGALQKVLNIIRSSVELRMIQPNLRLMNGLQNQIQIGSSTKFACLPVISDATMTELISVKTDAEFRKLIADLPADSC